jgi:hypothetical protein
MYITGSTDSSNLPKLNAAQATNGGYLDAFVSKLKPNGQALEYSTYLGGNENEFGSDIAVDAAGNAYVSGHTVSTNFPTKSPFQSQYGGGFFDGFATKFNATGGLAYSSYLGGNDFDRGFSVAVDTAGNGYYAGQTWSKNFLTANALQPTHAGNTDVYVTKVAPAGTVVYSTYLGGSHADLNWGGLHVNAAGAVYVSGGTESANFATVQPIQAVKGNIRDAFVSVINAAGSALTFSTFLGGNAMDDAYAIDVDSAGNIYLAGETFSTNFPTASPWQPNKNTFTDAFVVKIAP